MNIRFYAQNRENISLFVISEFVKQIVGRQFFTLAICIICNSLSMKELALKSASKQHHFFCKLKTRRIAPKLPRLGFIFLTHYYLQILS